MSKFEDSKPRAMGHGDIDYNFPYMDRDLPENLIIEENTVYVVDMECVKRKRQKKSKERQKFRM